MEETSSKDRLDDSNRKSWMHRASLGIGTLLTETLTYDLGEKESVGPEAASAEDGTIVSAAKHMADKKPSRRKVVPALLVQEAGAVAHLVKEEFILQQSKAPLKDVLVALAWNETKLVLWLMSLTVLCFVAFHTLSYLASLVETSSAGLSLVQWSTSRTPENFCQSTIVKQIYVQTRTFPAFALIFVNRIAMIVLSRFSRSEKLRKLKKRFILDIFILGVSLGYNFLHPVYDQGSSASITSTLWHVLGWFVALYIPDVMGKLILIIFNNERIRPAKLLSILISFMISPIVIMMFGGAALFYLRIVAYLSEGTQVLFVAFVYPVMEWLFKFQFRRFAVELIQGRRHGKVFDDDLIIDQNYETSKNAEKKAHTIQRIAEFERGAVVTLRVPAFMAMFFMKEERAFLQSILLTMLFESLGALMFSLLYNQGQKRAYALKTLLQSGEMRTVANYLLTDDDSASDRTGKAGQDIANLPPNDNGTSLGITDSVSNEPSKSSSRKNMAKGKYMTGKLVALSTEPTSKQPGEEKLKTAVSAAAIDFIGGGDSNSHVVKKLTRDTEFWSAVLTANQQGELAAMFVAALSIFVIFGHSSSFSQRTMGRAMIITGSEFAVDIVRSCFEVRYGLRIYTGKMMLSGAQTFLFFIYLCGSYSLAVSSFVLECVD